MQNIAYVIYRLFLGRVEGDKMTRRRQVPKGTKLGDLKKIGGFDLGLYMIDDEWSSKWELNPVHRTLRNAEKIKQNLKHFEHLISIMQDEYNRIVDEHTDLLIMASPAEGFTDEMYWGDLE